MKRFMIAATALTLATPALADQPRTLLEVREHFAADESGNDAKVFEDGTDGITSRGAQILAEIEMQPRMDGIAPSASQLLSQDRGFINERAAMIHKMLEAEEDGV